MVVTCYITFHSQTHKPNRDDNYFPLEKTNKRLGLKVLLPHKFPTSTQPLVTMLIPIAYQTNHELYQSKGIHVFDQHKFKMTCIFVLHEDHHTVEPPPMWGDN